jgi:hypothetical protein
VLRTCHGPLLCGTERCTTRLSTSLDSLKLLLLPALACNPTHVFFAVYCACCNTDCTASPHVVEGTDWACNLPAAHNSTCNSTCTRFYQPKLYTGPPTFCSIGTWINTGGSCERIPVELPNATYHVAQMSLAFSFTGGCTQQATSALINGLVADVHQAAANITNTTVSVKPGKCTAACKRAAGPAVGASS